MSEFERINTKAKSNISNERHEAIKRIVVAFLKLLFALFVIVALKAIGFISGTFAFILTAVAVCGGAFKTGYIWRDIKF